MFKPHIGSCNNCPRTQTWIVVKSGLCQYCNHERKQRNKSKTRPKTYRNLSTAGYIKESESHQSRWSSRKVDQKAKSSFRKTRKPIFKPKKGTGQAEIFAEIAEEREWICFVTQKSLMELTATQFMHVLPKALNKYPLFKLHKPNIQLATNEIHYLWDHTPLSELRKDRRFDKLFALEEQLKNEYKLLKTKT